MIYVIQKEEYNVLAINHDLVESGTDVLNGLLSLHGKDGDGENVLITGNYNKACECYLENEGEYNSDGEIEFAIMYEIDVEDYFYQDDELKILNELACGKKEYFGSNGDDVAAMLFRRCNRIEPYYPSSEFVDTPIKDLIKKIAEKRSFVLDGKNKGKTI